MRNLIAQTSNSLGEPLSGVGNIGLPDGGSEGVNVFARIISSIIGLLTLIGALYFLIVLITGAIGIISAGGDKGRYENAKSKITTGVIGLVVLISAMFLMDLIATLLGIENILDIGEMIDLISGG